MNWTPEMDEFLRNAHGTMPYREIGEKLGVGKHAVCGRVFRLKLPPLTTAPKKRYYEPKQWKPEKAAPKKKIKERIIEEPLIELQPLNIPFVALEPQHCREVVGSEGFGCALYCGHPVIHESSFCGWHHRINYTRAERKPALQVAA